MSLPLMLHQTPDPDRHAAFYDGIPAKRLGAWLIDAALIWVLTLLLVLLSAFVLAWVLPVLFVTLGIVYRYVALARASATPGMMLMAIEVRDHRGQPVRSATAMGLALGHAVTLSLVLPQILSAGLILATRRHQSLTDHLLGTVVINRPSRH